MLLSWPLLAGCINLTGHVDGTSVAGQERPGRAIQFLRDATWYDASGSRQIDQQIFDEAHRMIAGARRFILLDMFLYNSFQGREPETHRALADELTAQLVRARTDRPDLRVVVISDPVNTVYGGLPSPHFQRLESAGIEVVQTRLTSLRDSNACYSLFWRLIVKPFGNGPGRLMPNPFGAGRVSLRSWLAMLNFKANHRKLIVADAPDGLQALVTSANPHDGSSAHRNTAVRFSGPAIADLLLTESAVLRFSGRDDISRWPEFIPAPGQRAASPPDSDARVAVLTERAIKDAVLRETARLGPGDEADLIMFYLSDRDVTRALISAHNRGARVRLLLDPNKDAFGWKKSGIPNRPVAHRLHRAGLPVRWCDTRGEQCHAKTLNLRFATGERVLITGSANYTRRNLDDFNLETNVLIRAHNPLDATRAAELFFDEMWHNSGNRRASLPYADFADTSLLKRWRARFQEATGMGTF